VFSQVTTRREQTRLLGQSLIGLLSKVPYDRLVPGDGQRGFLDILGHARKAPDFAYAVVLDASGRLIAEVTSGDVAVPSFRVGSEPSSWTGERIVEPTPEGASGRGRSVNEFLGPVLSDGSLVGHVRVGFFEPGFGAVLGDSRFGRTLLLPVLLLIPLFYLLIRRERRPLSVLQASVGQLLEQDSLTGLQVDAPGGAGDFARSVNRLLERIEEQHRESQGQNTASLASSKIAAYQKSRIESVLETLPDAVIVLDESGTVMFANTGLDSLLGIKPKVAIGGKPAVWCTNADLLTFLLKLDGGGPFPHEGIEFFSDDSEKRRVTAAAYRLDPSSGGPPISGTLVLIRDVTAEAAARASQAEFVSHVAHELKSPLNVLGMYSEAILGKEGQSEDFRIEACNVIQDEVERLSSLISTLLAMARIEAGVVSLNRQRTRTPEYLRDIFETASRAARREDLDFQVDLSDAVTQIHVDKELLRVAINNLISNAIKYNRNGGRIVLSLRESDETISIEVRDTGVGIAPEEQEQIFDKFFRLPGAEAGPRSGHGLGLALAKQIVELHGGEIRVESTVGEGSQFTIVLPTAPSLEADA
jgi:signal transduction histidine kinase